MPKYGVFSGPYFPVFELNAKIYRGNLRMQSDYEKIRTRKNFVFGHFSCCFDEVQGPENSIKLHNFFVISPVHFCNNLRTRYAMPMKF